MEENGFPEIDVLAGLFLAKIVICVVVIVSDLILHSLTGIVTKFGHWYCKMVFIAVQLMFKIYIKDKNFKCFRNIVIFLFPGFAAGILGFSSIRYDYCELLEVVSTLYIKYYSNN